MEETQVIEESWCLVMDDTDEKPEYYEDLPEIPKEIRDRLKAYFDELKSSR